MDEDLTLQDKNIANILKLFRLLGEVSCYVETPKKKLLIFEQLF